MLGKKEKIKLCGSVLPKSHNIHKQGLGIGRNSKHNLLCVTEMSMVLEYALNIPLEKFVQNRG